MPVEGSATTGPAHLHARRLLVPPVAAQLALAAAGAQRPSLVVLVLDDDGLTVAVRDLDLGFADLPDTCATLVTLVPPRGPGAAVVVFVDPGSGTDPPAAAASAWHEARRRFRMGGVTLLDWLLVAGDDLRSVPAHFGEPTPW